MILLMLDAGLRAAELVGTENADRSASGGLTLADVNMVTGTIRLAGAGRSSARLISLLERTREALQEWLNARPLTENAHVFVTRLGERVSNRYVRQFLVAYSRSARLGRTATPGLLRLTFAVRLYQRTKDLRAVQRALGGASILTTARVAEHLKDE